MKLQQDKETDNRNLTDDLKGLSNEVVKLRLAERRKKLAGEVAQNRRGVNKGKERPFQLDTDEVVQKQRSVKGNEQWLEIAIENVSHDFNIGTIVRNANNFNVARVHIIGRKKYNRRGAMCTDKYLDIYYWEDVQSFFRDQRGRGRIVTAIENNVPKTRALLSKKFVQNETLVFGSEGDGLSQEMLTGVDDVRYIEGFGSTRSVNVGVASGIAMYEWVRQLILERK